jgi:hypothetical protein
MWALFVTGCDAQATADRGYAARLRVQDAQFVEGAMPADRGGPKLTFVDLRDTNVQAGDRSNPLLGRAAGTTFAIYVGVPGDVGYWTLPVGLPDEANPGELQFRAVLDYGRKLPPGPMVIHVQAADVSGVPGPVSTARLRVLSDVPDATLLFTLEWDADVDADLIVVDPTGVKVDAKNIASVDPPRPGQPTTGGDEAWRNGAVLDLDSNANCQIDGRRRENIFWQRTPPQGRYLVYAALHSTCGLTHTAFRLHATQAGVTRTFHGFLYATDGRSQPVAPPLSPGLLVTEFDVP